MARLGRTFPIRAHINYKGRAGIYFNRSLSKVVSETVTITDSIIRTIGRGITQSVLVTDTMTAIKATSKSIAEVITLTDSIALLREANIIISEMVTLTDYLFRSINRLYTEAVVLFDSIVNTKITTIQKEEPINIEDSKIIIRTTFLTMLENVTLIESAVKFAKRARDFIMGRNNDSGIKVGRSI